ncbi:hypothetical protein GCM10018790_52410 [Kitasatospora xanthocidica]|nr:hypothetical protein GCM10018790_52410 [Kitasatospora xanthocidica]
MATIAGRGGCRSLVVVPGGAWWSRMVRAKRVDARLAVTFARPVVGVVAGWCVVVVRGAAGRAS